MCVIGNIEFVQEQTWERNKVRVIEIALEVHPWSVPYGLVMVRRQSGRDITPWFCVERRSEEIMGTTPPSSVLFPLLFCIIFSLVDDSL
jgi:hypothetical protein